jgi:hypothetical protein
MSDPDSNPNVPGENVPAEDETASESPAEEGGDDIEEIPVEPLGDTEEAAEAVEEETQYVESSQEGYKEGRDEGIRAGIEQGLRLGRLELVIAQLTGIHQDRRERKRYASRVFWLLALWLIGITGIVFLSGLRWDTSLVSLSLEGYEFIWLYLPALLAGLTLVGITLAAKLRQSPKNTDKADSQQPSDNPSGLAKLFDQDEALPNRLLGEYSSLFREAAENPDGSRGVIKNTAESILQISLVGAPLLTWYFAITEWEATVSSFDLPESVLNTLLA